MWKSRPSGCFSGKAVLPLYPPARLLGALPAHGEGHRAGKLVCRSQCGPDPDDQGAPCPGPALHCCRFESQRAPLRERRTALEARSLLLQSFKDTDEEMAWVREKLSLTAARDCGQSPSALQRLQEKCQVLAQREGRGHRQSPRAGSFSLDSLVVTGAGFSLGAAVGSHQA